MVSIARLDKLFPYHILYSQSSSILIWFLEHSFQLQLVELLSIRAPAPEVKLNLLKEIAEEHQLDWDPTATESELLKPHEDLLVRFTAAVPL